VRPSSSPAGALAVAAAATAAVLLCDPRRHPLGLLAALLLFTLWAGCCTPPPPWRRLLLVLPPVLGGVLGITLLAALGGGDIPAILLGLGLRALLIALLWARLAPLLTLPALASVLHGFLGLRTPASLLLVIHRMLSITAREITHRRRAILSRAPRPRRPGPVGLFLHGAARSFQGTAHRSRRMAWAMESRGYRGRLEPAPVSPDPNRLLDGATALLLLLLPAAALALG